VSGYAVYTIRAVRAEIIARATLPILTTALEKHAKTLYQIIEATDTEQQVRAELARCEANVTSIVAKLPRRNGLRVRRLASLLEKELRSPSLNRPAVWRIYAELNGVLQELTNVLMDQRVGK
jgi:hypothetical protein